MFKKFIIGSAVLLATSIVVAVVKPEVMPAAFNKALEPLLKGGAHLMEKVKSGDAGVK